MGNLDIIIWGFICAFYILPLILCAGLIVRSRQNWISRIAKLEKKAKELKEESDKLDSIDKEVKERELLSVGLYDFTKRMSHCLKFDEIVVVLESFLNESLRERFIFERGELAVLKEKDGAYDIDKVYLLSNHRAHLSSGRQAPEKKSSYDFTELLKVSGASKRGAFITAESDPAPFEALKVSKSARTFSVMPIMNEKKLSAILAMEGLDKDDFEMLGIISIQFALQTKKVLLYETVEYLSITDGLTGLYGRRYFLERLGEELARAKSHKLAFSFLMADIDHFKVTNDTYGHLVGDVALKEIARLIKESLREIDLVARYGGEEFSAILPDTKKEDGARVAERIRARIEGNLFRAYDETLKLTISIGVSSYPNDGEDVDSIIDAADKAVYQGKSDGRNLVRLFER